MRRRKPSGQKEGAVFPRARPRHLPVPRRHAHATLGTGRIARVRARFACDRVIVRASRVVGRTSGTARGCRLARGVPTEEPDRGGGAVPRGFRARHRRWRDAAVGARGVRWWATSSSRSALTSSTTRATSRAAPTRRSVRASASFRAHRRVDRSIDVRRRPSLARLTVSPRRLTVSPSPSSFPGTRRSRACHASRRVRPPNRPRRRRRVLPSRRRGDDPSAPPPRRSARRVSSPRAPRATSTREVRTRTATAVSATSPCFSSSGSSPREASATCTAAATIGWTATPR